jgi:hypothetical protein
LRASKSDCDVEWRSVCPLEHLQVYWPMPLYGQSEAALALDANTSSAHARMVICLCIFMVSDECFFSGILASDSALRYLWFHLYSFSTSDSSARLRFVALHLPKAFRGVPSAFC